MEALRVERLSKNFGGIQVVTDASFTVQAGERLAIIGPNGAGKTTMFNMLNGQERPSDGRVYLFGQDITTMPTYSRAHLGLARSFQVNALFPNLSLLNNILLAVQGIKPDRFQMLRSITAYEDNFTRAKELLELVGLWERRDDLVMALSHGQQRQIEILLALASEPKLLMLDEPSAGLSASETEGFIDMMRGLTAGTTLFFVAHDMDVVFALAERVMVLYYGGIIAQGTPKEIQNNPQVKEIYLGMQAKNAQAS